MRPSSHSAGRWITDWFKSIGLRIIDFQAMQDGLINDHIYEYKGDYYAPNYDMYIWDWVGYADPSDTLVSWTSDQIENGWNDTCWSNAEYDDLFKQQMSAVDLERRPYDNTARRDLIWRMQDIFYKASPYVFSTTPTTARPTTSRSEGWVRITNNGAVVYQNDNIDTYLFVHPRAASVESEGGGNSAWIWVFVGTAVVAAVVVVVVLRRRRGPGAEEV